MAGMVRTVRTGKAEHRMKTHRVCVWGLFSSYFSKDSDQNPECGLQGSVWADSLQVPHCLLDLTYPGVLTFTTHQKSFKVLTSTMKSPATGPWHMLFPQRFPFPPQTASPAPNKFLQEIQMPLTQGSLLWPFPGIFSFRAFITFIIYTLVITWLMSVSSTRP